MNEKRFQNETNFAIHSFCGRLFSIKCRNDITAEVFTAEKFKDVLEVSETTATGESDESAADNLFLRPIRSLAGV